MAFRLSDDFLADHNATRRAWLEEDYQHLGRQLARRGVDIERLVERAAAFRVSLPSWGVGTGGTRFARFAGPGEPRDVFEKLDDCEAVLKLVRVTPGPGAWWSTRSTRTPSRTSRGRRARTASAA